MSLASGIEILGIIRGRHLFRAGAVPLLLLKPKRRQRAAIGQTRFGRRDCGDRE